MTDGIDITPEMVARGAAVLVDDYYLDGIGEGYAELLTRRVLMAALGTLLVAAAPNSVIDTDTVWPIIDTDWPA